MLESSTGMKLGTDSEMHLKGELLLNLFPIDMYGVLLLSTPNR
jgi:hypothetical protein